MKVGNYYFLLFLKQLKNQILMKTVIRIEHPSDGWGIFTKRIKGKTYDNPKLGLLKDEIDYSCWDIGTMRNKHDKMICATSVKGFTNDYFCAYPSVDMMKQWIDCSEIKQLIALGFVVLILDVTDYIESIEQTLYTKDSIVSSKDISSLFL